MAWFWLLLAGILEIGWALGLKASEGLTRWKIGSLSFAGYVLSFFLLAHAMKTLPVGTAYAVWTGIGAMGTALLGMVLFHESRDPSRLFCIGLIAAGILGLKFLAR